MSLDPIVKNINSELVREFGYFLDKPKFRVVWTGDQIEKRLALFGNSETPELKEVPKYPYVKPSWWMLERAVEFQDESVKDGNNYEPLYLFRHFNDKGEYGEFLPPRLDMAVLACKMSLVKKPTRNAAMDKSDFDIKEAKAEKDIFEKIKDASSDMSHLFHWKEAVIMDGKSTELPVSPNLKEKE